jgi:hypothetical protein
VEILTAGNVEFKADHRAIAVVWLELVPLLARKGADEALGDAGQHKNTGNKNRASGVPIPRAALRSGNPRKR